MNKDQKKQLNREKRRLQREKRARLEKELEELDPIEEELDVPDEIEKSMDNMVGVPVMSAMSFSQLDQAMDAQHKAMKVNETSYAVQDLVRNIVNYPEFSPEEKSAAIKSVADEFGTRVRMIMESPMQKAAVDALVLEVTQARDKRIINSSEGIKGMVLKTVRSAADKLGIDMPPEKDTNAVQIEKDANGDWRAVMWVSNKFRDLDKEIICEDAHKEYVEWVNLNKEFMPVFMTWHTPDTVRENPVDYMDYMDGFLVASAKLTEPEAMSLMEVSKEVSLGISHGSFALARDPNDPRIITKYRMYEVSDLPLKNAANPFTDLETISKEVGMDKMEYLSKIIGADKAKAFIEKLGLKKQALEDAEIDSKEKTEEVPVVEEPVVEVPVIEPVVEKTADPDLVAQVMKAMDIDGLNEFVVKAQAAMEKVATLEELVKELSANQDEKLAEMIAPPITKQLAWARPSVKDDNVINKDDELAKKVPGLPEGFWLSEATGTEPIKETV